MMFFLVVIVPLVVTTALVTALLLAARAREIPDTGAGWREVRAGWAATKARREAAGNRRLERRTVLTDPNAEAERSGSWG